MGSGARARLVDVARAANVSVSAASIALNGRSGVSDQTRERIGHIARKLGYVPDIAAASMRTGRTCLLGFVSELGHPAVPAFAGCAIEAGCLLVFATPADIGSLISRGIDGAVVLGSDKAATAWSKTGRPLVVLGTGRLPRGALRVDPVDPAAAATQAVAALLTPGA